MCTVIRTGITQPAPAQKLQPRLPAADVQGCHCPRHQQRQRGLRPPPLLPLPGQRAPGRLRAWTCPRLAGALTAPSSSALCALSPHGNSDVLLSLGPLEWYSLGAFVAALVVVAAAGRQTKPTTSPAVPVGTQAEDPLAAGQTQWTPREVWRQAGGDRVGAEGTGRSERRPGQQWHSSEQPMRHPQSSLQALTAPARAELLRKSVCALERGTAGLPEDLCRGSALAWQQAVQQLIETASGAVAEEWLGRPLPSLLAEDTSTVKASGAGQFDDTADEAAAPSGITGNDTEAMSTGTTPGALLAERAVIHAVVLRQLRFSQPGSSSRSPDRRSQTLRASAPAVVQDLAVVVADRVASALLEEVRCCPSPAEALEDQQLDWPEVLHPRLASTRAVERFCNQVLLWKWWEVNFRSVQAIYEDRFVLWGFRPEGILVRRPVPARRGWELPRLQGTRAVVAIFLEAMDVAWPVCAMVFSRCREALCWMLVAIIGQSLGLVARGIRKSMNSRDNEDDLKGTARPRGRQERRRSPKDEEQTPWTVPTGYGDGAFAF